MLLTTVVLTGGPCGGKTTALKLLQKRLNDEGYYCLTTDEQFTEILNAGTMRPGVDNPDEEYIRYFNQKIMECDIALQHMLTSLAHVGAPEKRVVILSDRGPLDSFGFLAPEVSNGITIYGHSVETVCRLKYDLVVHMQSLAVDRPDLYTCDNNEHRVETADQSFDCDIRIQKAWNCHDNRVIVDNSGSLDQKLEKVYNLIKAEVAKQESNLEVERKFTASIADSIMKSYDCAHIEQKYKMLAPGDYIRYRQQDGVYTATAKTGVNLSRKERTIHITKEEYDSIRDVDGIVVKDRYTIPIPSSDLNMEVDTITYPVPLCLVEVEIPSKDHDVTTMDLAISVEGVTLHEDVTDVQMFKNLTLAKQFKVERPR